MFLMKKYPNELKLLGTGIIGEGTKELAPICTVYPRQLALLTSWLAQHLRARKYPVT